jgi:hypothetical protein
MDATNDEQQLVEEIGRHIDWYSTAILRIRTDDDDPQEDHQIGSGTFVSLEGQYGVLTAHHVIAELDGHCSLGLILESGVHRFVIEENHFTICELAVPNVPSLGPDLAFIGVYNPDIGTIKARKQFYELSGDRQKVLAEMPGIDRGVWFLWGVPAEDTTIEPAEKGHEIISGLHSLCGPAKATSEQQVGEHDYIEIEVEYGQGLHVPQSFGGFSGGGIWQVSLENSGAGKLVPLGYVLSGVAFFQSGISNQRRYIRCHGRRSIYAYAYNKLKNGCA